MTWVVINIALSLLLSIVGAYLIGGYGERFNWLERGGIATQAGAAVLRIGPILSHDSLVVSISPFDDWSGCLFVFGGAMALVGIVCRLEGFSPAARLAVGSGEGWFGRWRHKRRNAAAVQDAKQRLRERGRL